MVEPGIIPKKKRCYILLRGEGLSYNFGTQAEAYFYDSYSQAEPHLKPGEMIWEVEVHRRWVGVECVAKEVPFP